MKNTRSLGNLIYPFDRDLECFAAIFEAGTISGAASTLDTDPGNLSKSLKRLEEKMGVALFHRHHKGLLPTAEGKHLAGTLQYMEKIWKGSQQSADGDVAEPVQIGCHASVGRSYLPKILPALVDASQGIPLEINFLKSIEATRQVMARQLELAIVVNVVRSHDLIVKPVATEKIEMSGQREITDDSVLLFNPDMLFVGKIVRDLSFKRILEIRDYETIAAICEENPNYVGVLPSGVRERYRSLKSLHALKEEITVNLVTFQGSRVVPWLKDLQKSLKV